MRARFAVHAMGEVLITLGVIALLFVGYQVFWTNIEANAASHSVTERLRDDWGTSSPAASTSGSVVGSPTAAIPAGAFALMRIPRLGADWQEPVLEPAGATISLDDLAQGVVHYKQTAQPGQVGNFAVAGHRQTHGQPFRHLEQLRPGDQVIIETRTATYTYVIDNDPNSAAATVLPNDVWVLDPVPGKPGAKPTQAIITLTTCTPWWTSTYRMIAFGHLTTTVPKH